MNKIVSTLVGVAVVVGAVATGGAWYTGQQVEGVLLGTVANINSQIKASRQGASSTAHLELLSVERHWFTSTAHYRFTIIPKPGAQAQAPVELLFVDHIEHGPLPWSRVKQAKLWPVMVTSHYELERNDATAKWFDATHGVPPVGALVNLGYDNGFDGTLELIPADIQLDAVSTLQYSGLKLDLSADADANNLKLQGYMDLFKLDLRAPDRPPLQVNWNGLTLASHLHQSPYGFYLGNNLIELSSASMTFGAPQKVLALKKFEQKTDSSAEGEKLNASLAYSVADVTLDGQPLGNVQLALSAKRLDIPALQAGLKIIEQAADRGQAAAPAGSPRFQVELSADERAAYETQLLKVLSGKPQVALDNLSLKTANGESRINLLVDLDAPTSTTLPSLELGQQVVKRLDANVSLSKPMLSDVGALQARLQGQSDPQRILQQANLVSEMTSILALSSQMAVLEGADVVSRLRYANGQVNLNGKDIPLEQFLGLLMNNFAGLVRPAP
ncbi:YdgA family protein [Pseudomonas sp. nanlin1]|uniref:YdgA family protein n=1 Tax=Pseudomonas sp. nanlin1 TaxID=3040605 RepID=UPI00388DE49A